MKTLSSNQLQDAHGTFIEAVKPFGGLVQAEVPRPTFHAFEEWAIKNNVQSQQGNYMLPPRATLPGFAGLMAVALVPRKNQAPHRVAGIVLEDERQVGVLGGHETLTPLSQALLSTVYLNNRQNVLDHPNGTVQAGFGGHAVIAASALASRGNVHNAVHAFGRDNFGTEMTRQGLQDIRVGHNTISVRAGTFALHSVGLIVASHFQPDSAGMFGSVLSGEAANVALTLAATLSNPDKPKIDLERSFSEMSS